MNAAFWEEHWRRRFDSRDIRRATGSPVPDMQYWDARAGDLSALRKSNDYDFGRAVYDAVGTVLNEDSCVLDVGAGPGSLTIPFARCVRHVTALEPSSEMIRRLKKNAEEVGTQNYDIIPELLEDVASTRMPHRYDLVVTSGILWIFRDIWPMLEMLESLSDKYCAVVSNLPKEAVPSVPYDSIAGEFQILFNLLLSHGRLPNIQSVPFHCERPIEEELQSRVLLESQFNPSVSQTDRERFRLQIESASENGLCRTSKRAVVIRWDKHERI